MPIRPEARGAGKRALVLAGGGVTGAAYELGALQALNEFLGDGAATNQFDIFVGTSAGAILTSLLANGITVESMFQVLDGAHPAVRGLERSDVFGLNVEGLLRWGAHLPIDVLRACARGLPALDLSAVLLGLTEGAPSGLYDSRALARYLAEALSALGGSDRFEDLTAELFLIATNIDTGQRAVFGRGHRSGVTISQAVAASTALPLLYQPVRIGRHAYMDGGLRGNASLDVAVEHGARLVVCINPIVPHVSLAEEEPAAAAASIAWRALRISSHAGLHYHLKHLRRQHPEVDIVLIEPPADDAELLTTNFMDFGARHSLARHGYAAVREQLAERAAEYEVTLARRGLRRKAGADLGEGLRCLSGDGANLGANGHTTQLAEALESLEQTLETIPADGREVEAGTARR